MEILYTITEKQIPGVVVFIGLAIFLLIAAVASFLDDETPLGVFFLCLCVLCIILSIFIFNIETTYVYAKINKSAPYIEYAEKYKFIEHQGDVYKLEVLK